MHSNFLAVEESTTTVLTFTSKLHLPLSVVYITAEERNFKAKGVLKEILFGREFREFSQKA
jgi:hypothetical protein